MLAKNIIIDGINELYLHRKIVCKQLLVPVFFLWGLGIPLDSLNDSHSFKELCQYIYLGLCLLLQAHLAITIHRIILLADGSLTLNFGRLFMYIWYSIVISMICMPAFAFTFIPSIGLYLAAIVVALVFTSLSLIFPSIAVEDDLTLGRVWELSREYLGSLIICMFMMGFVTNGPSYLFKEVWDLKAVSDLFGWVTAAINMSILSVAYRSIIRNKLESN